MNGDALTLGAVAALAVAGGLRRRGSRARRPTDEDLEAGRMLGVPLHDHIIVGRGGGWTSLAEQGLM